MRQTWPIVFFLVVGCGNVSDPTAKGTVLIEWDRSTAKGYDPKDSAGGPKHPIVDAKIVEGPKTHSYTVTLKGIEGRNFSFDLDVDAGKASLPAEGKVTHSWSST